MTKENMAEFMQFRNDNNINSLQEMWGSIANGYCEATVSLFDTKLEETLTADDGTNLVFDMPRAMAMVADNNDLEPRIETFTKLNTEEV